LEQKGEHITARLAPTGRRAAFGKKWLRNLAEAKGLAAQDLAEDALWKSLTPVERQIVTFHRRRKSTSPRYEAILAEHPHLRDKRS
jgi:hypothetical protein